VRRYREGPGMITPAASARRTRSARRAGAGRGLRSPTWWSTPN